MSRTNARRVRVPDLRTRTVGPKQLAHGLVAIAPDEPALTAGGEPSRRLGSRVAHTPGSERDSPAVFHVKRTQAQPQPTGGQRSRLREPAPWRPRVP